MWPFPVISRPISIGICCFVINAACHPFRSESTCMVDCTQYQAKARGSSQTNATDGQAAVKHCTEGAGLQNGIFRQSKATRGAAVAVLIAANRVIVSLGTTPPFGQENGQENATQRPRKAHLVNSSPLLPKPGLWPQPPLTSVRFQASLSPAACQGAVTCCFARGGGDT